MNSWAKLIKTSALATQPKIETKPLTTAQIELHRLCSKMLGEAKKLKTHTLQEEDPRLEWCPRVETHIDQRGLR